MNFSILPYVPDPIRWIRNLLNKSNKKNWIGSKISWSAESGSAIQIYPGLQEIYTAPEH